MDQYFWFVRSIPLRAFHYIFLLSWLQFEDTFHGKATYSLRNWSKTLWLLRFIGLGCPWSASPISAWAIYTICLAIVVRSWSLNPFLIKKLLYNKGRVRESSTGKFQIYCARCSPCCSWPWLGKRLWRNERIKVWWQFVGSLRDGCWVVSILGLASSGCGRASNMPGSMMIGIGLDLHCIR